MKGPQPSSPLQLTLWAGAGALLVEIAICYASASHALRYPIQGAGLGPVLWANRLNFAVCFLPFIAGAIVWAQSLKRLRNGIKNDLWSEDDLASLRRCFDHAAWTVLSVVCVLVMLSQVVLSKHVILGPTYWVSFWTLQTFSQLRIALKRKTTGSVGLKNWQEWTPIRSEHWGEPPSYEGPSVHS